MTNYKYKELFKQDSVDKQMKITFEGGEISNEDIYAESFTLKESLCSDSELHFGSCEASMLEIKIRNEFGELKGKWLTVSMVLDSHTDKPFQFGKYKVISDEASGDRKYTNITAFDAMHDIIHAEVVTWYDGLTFPMTLKEFRDSFFAYFGITQEETTLIQDDMIVEKTIDSNSISGKDVITAICELNGTFGHINRQGNFEYVSLERKFEYLHPGASIYPGENTGLDKGKYPSEEIYPSDDFYPGQSIYPGMIMDLDYPKHDITPSLYRSCEYADFETELITKVQIRMEEGDIGAVTGKGNNCYIVEDNFLVYGKSSKELSRICRRLFGKLFGIQYRPFKAVVKGNPCIEVGDIVNIQAKYKDIEGYVLERTLTGIQALKDDMGANGVYEYTERVNSPQRELKKLKGKTNVLKRTVEETKLTISDMEKAISTTIKQLADSISISVDENGNIKTSLELDKNGMSFKGNKVVFGFDNFKIDEDGNVEVSGKYTNKSLRGNKAIEIDKSIINFYSWANDNHYTGSICSTYAEISKRDGIMIAVNQGDKIGLGYTSGPGENIYTLMEFDTKDLTNVPYIKNTANGTLFSNNKNGITVKNGLITDWGLDTMSGTISLMSDVSLESGKVTGIYTTDIEVKNGLISNWRKYKSWP